MNEGDTSRSARSSDVLGSDRVDAISGLDFRLCMVNRGVSRTVDDKTAGVDSSLHRNPIGDVTFGAPQRGTGNAALVRTLGEGAADLPLRSQYQQVRHRRCSTIANARHSQIWRSLYPTCRDLSMRLMRSAAAVDPAG
jgi:hypothetical protein